MGYWHKIVSSFSVGYVYRQEVFRFPSRLLAMAQCMEFLQLDTGTIKVLGCIVVSELVATVHFP